MSTPTPDAGTLWTVLRTAPDDTLKLALADYLEEHGDPNTGYALRWCVGHNCWPRLTKTLAIWYADSSQQHPGKPEEIKRALLPLPFLVIGADCQKLDQLTRISTGIAFHSLAVALEYLGWVLARLRDWAALTEVK